MTCFYGGTSGKFSTDSPNELSHLLEKELPAIYQLHPGISFPGGVHAENRQNELFEAHNQPIGISWEHEEFSKGSYSSWGVGQFALFDEKDESFGEEVRKVFRPSAGTIFFAGEHTALDNPATLEGAVESGERTAKMLKRVCTNN